MAPATALVSEVSPAEFLANLESKISHSAASSRIAPAFYQALLSMIWVRRREATDLLSISKKGARFVSDVATFWNILESVSLYEEFESSKNYISLYATVQFSVLR